jgi:hypothetical protein
MMMNLNAPSDQPPTEEWDRVRAEFFRLIGAEAINAMQPFGPGTIFTAFVTVWLLIYQRISHNASLQEAVVEFATLARTLSENKRVEENNLSMGTGSYSQARTRLSPGVLDAVAKSVFDTLVGSTASSLRDRRVFVFDGTSVPLAPEPGLREQWPPGDHSGSVSAWPIGLMALAHELSSGLAMAPEIGAMYGPEAVSEIALAKRFLPRLPPRSVVLADRNFGVLTFVHAAVAAGHEVVARLTDDRFESMLRHAEPRGSGRWKGDWHPSAWERKRHPERTTESVVTVWLFEMPLADGTMLRWLSTDASITREEGAALSARRGEIETDIRHLQSTLKADAIRGKSAAMVLKEIAVVVLTYNLVVQVRKLAAAKAEVAPKRLSFKGVWHVLRLVLLEPSGGENGEWTSEQWQRKFEQALRMAAKMKLPPRKKRRSYPREVLPKNGKFPKRKPPEGGWPTANGTAEK